MKKLSDVLSKPVEDMNSFLNPLERRGELVPTGCAPVAGKTITPSRLTHEELLDILSLLRPHLLPLIRRETLKVEPSVLKSLELIQQKAVKDDCTYWIGRLLAHFPRQDVTKDAIVMTDIASALLEKEVTSAGLCEACRHLWLASKSDKPFMPPSGQIVEDAASWTRCFASIYERTKNV